MSQGFDTTRIALGTAGLAGLWGPVDRREALRTIHMALEAGILHLDTAPAYVDAEGEGAVGQTVIDAIGGLYPTGRHPELRLLFVPGDAQDRGWVLWATRERWTCDQAGKQ
ncbi:MAG: hypothetical protein FJX89_00260 [Bacteroidetes bacterium]|nr:hypothetical protein [Bacteroidota bacterium]